VNSELESCEEEGDDSCGFWEVVDIKRWYLRWKMLCLERNAVRHIRGRSAARINVVFYSYRAERRL
jgi:hypothetical protein